MYDVIIVGGGPAGMTAALYARRNGKSALVIEKNGFGGQITHSPRVENYPGTLSMSGNEFADSLLEQILAQGAEIEYETVKEVQRVPGPGIAQSGAQADGAGNSPLILKDTFRVLTEEGGSYEGRTVILATGVKHRMLGLEGEQDLVGEGISFCAVCDGDFYAGKTVCVAGGGNSALQEATLLAEKCAEVILLQDLPYFTGEEQLQKALFARDNVRTLTQVKITQLLIREGELTGVAVESDGERREIACDGLFVAIGLIPENEPFGELAQLNRFGYFDSDEQCLTRTPGVFVAGDCRSKQVRQLTTASADGATAALAACRFINGV